MTTPTPNPLPTSTTSENRAEDRGLAKRQSFLKYPGEDSGVDYKDGVVLQKGDDFCLKLVRHVLGMANAGGGYIVIGYKENAAKHPEPINPMPSAVAASYDVSILADMVEKYKAGSEKVSLRIHKDKHPDTAVVYPVIEVDGFERRPFFCKSDAGGVLQLGALYLRVASARTIRVASPDEWDQLIDLCVRRRQDELVQRVGDLTRQLGLPIAQSPVPGPREKGLAWIEDRRRDLLVFLKKESLPFEGLEVAHRPVDLGKTWTPPQLRDAARTAMLRNTGWPIGLVLNRPDLAPAPIGDGVRVTVAGDNMLDYWYFDKDGSFYFFRTFEEDNTRGGQLKTEAASRMLRFDSRIWRIAEVIQHCEALYKALPGMPPNARIHLFVNHVGISGRLLGSSNPMRSFMMSSRECVTPEVVWDKEVTLDALQATTDDVIFHICRRLFAMFDFWEPHQSVLDSVLAEYKKSHV